MKLKNCCDILDSKRIPITAANRKKGPYPYYGANGVQDYVDDYIFDDELVLLAEDGGNFGSKEKPIAYRISGKCWINNHAHVLKPKNDLNVDYLCYSLAFYNVDKLINGATRKKLTQSAVKDMEIPIVPLATQQKIVNQIKKVQLLKSTKKKRLNKLDELIKARFVEMFGDPVLNSHHYNLVKLSNLGTLARGKSKHRPRNDPQLLGGPYPLIQTGEITNSDIFIKRFTNTYSELGLQQSKMWPKGTLCITIAANIAQTAILAFNACFPDSVVGFIPENCDVMPLYLHYWFSFFQKIIDSQASQVAQKNINLKVLSNLEVMLPPKNKQNEFANFVQQVDKSKFENIVYLNKTLSSKILSQLGDAIRD
ncbi:restriction endonuclease subunit S [Lactobacillus taiwanensis]|uniref:restriction endonuclease subunit S n=1 Tax=Lactobacillus taiwanensis TaxID=508451 RepID=UPI0024200716|nr:restriction endonuclease subunit S [Lactobacillus taiwanensis]